MAKILVTGSLGWDVPIWLNSPLVSGGRIRARGLPASNNSPALPGRLLPGRLGGGAANIAAALVRVGHEVWVCGRIGDDADGRFVLQALKARGIQTDFVEVCLVPTSSAQILIEPDGERTILGFSHNQPINAHTSFNIGSNSEALEAANFDCLIQRGGWPSLPLRPRLVLAHIPTYSEVALDVDVVVGGLSDLGEGTWHAPLATIRRQFPCASWGVITNGAAGLIAQSEADGFEMKPPAATVVDATGAGDVFMAGLADALLAGADMRDACGHGAMWGGICVGLEGSAAAPDESRYKAFIRGPNET